METKAFVPLVLIHLQRHRFVTVDKASVDAVRPHGFCQAGPGQAISGTPWAQAIFRLQFGSDAAAQSRLDPLVGKHRRMPQRATDGEASSQRTNQEVE